MPLYLPPILVSLATLAGGFGCARVPLSPPVCRPFLASAAGIGLIVGGLVLVALAVRQFSRLGTTVKSACPEQARGFGVDGPVRFSRNPMSLGKTIALAGFALAVGSLAGLFAAAWFWQLIDRFPVPAEERALAAHIRQASGASCACVLRWL